MASGHRKRKAAAVRLEVLNPAGLTNASEADRGILNRQNNLLNISIYSKDGVTPTFTNGSTTLLSDNISNGDNAFGLAGLTGETTNAGVFNSGSLSGAIGIDSSTKHYYFPAVGSLGQSLSVNPPLIIYSPEGPQAKYVPYYLGGTAATASFFFDSKITGSGTASHVAVYIGGELSSNDQIRLLHATGAVLDSRFATGSNTSFSPVVGVNTATASAAQLSANLYRKAFLIPTGALSSGMIVEFSSSAKVSTAPVAGVFIAISSGSYLINGNKSP